MTKCDVREKMENKMENKDNQSLLKTVAFFGGYNISFDDDSIKITGTVDNSVPISSVTHTIHHHETPQELYCIGVPGKAFVVKDRGEISVTGNTLHVEGMLKVFRTLVEENPKVWTDEFKKEIYEIAREMVKMEDAFIDLCFENGGVEGLTPEEVKKYIRYIADRRLLQLGLKTNWKVKDNPLPWLDWVLGGVEHQNFFEGRSTEYSKGTVEGWEDAFDDEDGNNNTNQEDKG